MSGEPTERRVTSPPALSGCLSSPGWLLSPGLKHITVHRIPGPAHLIPMSPPCILLARQPAGFLSLHLHMSFLCPGGFLSCITSSGASRQMDCSVHRGDRCGEHLPVSGTSSFTLIPIHCLALSSSPVNSLPKGSSVPDTYRLLWAAPCSVSALHKGIQQGALVGAEACLLTCAAETCAHPEGALFLSSRP